MKYLIALFLWVAVCLSAWLSWQKWSGRIDSLAGCGAGSGCANVLGSKWSVVFGSIPVSAFSLALYLSLLLTLGMKSRWVLEWRRLAAWLCLWAALWFTLLQIAVIGNVCPYCMTMHGVGSLLGIALLWMDAKGETKNSPFWGRNRYSMGLALMAVIILSLIQLWGPEPPTHRLDHLEISQGASAETDVHGRGQGRLLTFLNGAKSYRVDELPHMGDSSAEHVVVEYFDYTCQACRDMHLYLEAMVKKYPRKLAVVVLVVPLHTDCNPHLPKALKNSQEEHEQACDLARLALKVWRVAPEKFSDFHHQLFEYQGLPLAAAESLAASSVGDEQILLRRDPWVEEVLAQNVSDYGQLIEKTPVMPKLLLGGSSVIQGLGKDQQAIEELLNEHLKLQ